jgi:hypothetical protein
VQSEYFQKLADSFEAVEKCYNKWLSIYPSLEQKLTLYEEQTSILEGHNYTSAEIENIVTKQILNHPINKDLEEAMERLEEVMGA